MGGRGYQLPYDHSAWEAEMISSNVITVHGRQRLPTRQARLATQKRSRFSETLSSNIYNRGIDENTKCQIHIYTYIPTCAPTYVNTHAGTPYTHPYDESSL